MSEKQKFEIGLTLDVGKQWWDVTASCRCCSKEKRFSFRRRHMNAHDDIPSETTLSRKFMRLGWKIGDHMADHLCPTCAEALGEGEVRS